jgi:hypothetical protein
VKKVIFMLEFAKDLGEKVANVVKSVKPLIENYDLDGNSDNGKGFFKIAGTFVGSFLFYYGAIKLNYFLESVGQSRVPSEHISSFLMLEKYSYCILNIGAVGFFIGGCALIKDNIFKSKNSSVSQNSKTVISSVESVVSNVGYNSLDSNVIFPSIDFPIISNGLNNIEDIVEKLENHPYKDSIKNYSSSVLEYIPYEDVERNISYVLCKFPYKKNIFFELAKNSRNYLDIKSIDRLFSL